jgi:hypothetical protein
MGIQGPFIPKMGEREQRRSLSPRGEGQDEGAGASTLTGQLRF